MILIIKQYVKEAKTCQYESIRTTAIAEYLGMLHEHLPTVLRQLLLRTLLLNPKYGRFTVGTYRLYVVTNTVCIYTVLWVYADDDGTRHT